MQRNVVECVTKTKFLGVIIDNKLKWNDHITYVKSKISKTIGLFYKMRQYLGKTALVNLYYSLVFSYLIYCNEIWGNASSVHLDPIIKIQKRCVRIITYSDYLSSSEPIFQTLNILNFRKLVVQRISLLMFKIYKSDVPPPQKKIIHIIRIIREEVTISIHLLVGQKRYTKHLAFMEFIYGIIYQVPYKLMFLTRLLNV